MFARTVIQLDFKRINEAVFRYKVVRFFHLGALIGRAAVIWDLLVLIDAVIISTIG